jgi:NADPH:quinone reductase-like Zn-dependent oxidoreductase
MFILIDSNFAKCYKIKNLSDEEATLLEPASCAIHGMDKLKMPFGAKVLLIGAGPTGLILAQLMKIGGAGHITIAANKGECYLFSEWVLLGGTDVRFEDGHCPTGRGWRCLH